MTSGGTGVGVGEANGSTATTSSDGPDERPLAIKTPTDPKIKTAAAATSQRFLD
jgi:hypothetical protein